MQLIHAGIRLQPLFYKMMRLHKIFSNIKWQRNTSNVFNMIWLSGTSAFIVRKKNRFLVLSWTWNSVFQLLAPLKTWMRQRTLSNMSIQLWNSLGVKKKLLTRFNFFNQPKYFHFALHKIKSCKVANYFSAEKFYFFKFCNYSANDDPLQLSGYI